MEQYHSNLETRLSSGSEDEIFEGFDPMDVNGASRVFETVIRENTNANASTSDSVSSDEHGDNSIVSGDDSSSSSDDYSSSDHDASSSDHHGHGTSSESEEDSNEPIFTDLKSNPPDWTTNFTPIDVPGFGLQSAPHLPDGWDIHSPPLKYFLLFFTPDIIEQFVKYTNEYAQIAIRKKRETVPSYTDKQWQFQKRDY